MLLLLLVTIANHCCIAPKCDTTSSGFEYCGAISCWFNRRMLIEFIIYFT